MYEQHLGGIHL